MVVLVAAPEPIPEGEVLAMDDITDSSEYEVIPPPPMIDPEVEVVFLDLQNLPAFQVEEVQR